MNEFENEKNLNESSGEIESSEDVFEKFDNKDQKANDADDFFGETNPNEQTEIIGEEELPLAEDVQNVKNPVKEIISWVICIGVAIAIALLLRSNVFTMVKVDGQSMEPTLHHGERLFTRIIGYTPSRGDVIIFHPRYNPQTAYVKRVIATEGDRIRINQPTGDVYLMKDGETQWEILDEPYIKEKILSNMIPYANSPEDMEYLNNLYITGEGVLVEKDHIFVMGDNRNNSSDSRDPRSVGLVHKDSILGKASFRWWPISEFGSIYPEDSKETKILRIVGYSLIGIFVLVIGFWIWKKYFRKTGN